LSTVHLFFYQFFVALAFEIIVKFES